MTGSLFREPLDGVDAERWAALCAAARGGAYDPPPEGVESALDELYGPLVRSGGRPFVVGQLGQSLDGRIATASGHSQWVTGEASLVHLHRLRALVDAVVVGWRTAVVDDPRLTVRNCEGRDPLRVVLDVRDEVPLEGQMFTGPGRALRIVGVPSPRRDEESDVLQLPAPEGRFDPTEVVRALASAGYPRLLVEGGGQIVTGFLRAGALDRLHVTVAPLFIGEGRAGIALPGVERLDGALRPSARVWPIGCDALFDLDVAAEI